VTGLLVVDLVALAVGLVVALLVSRSRRGRRISLVSGPRPPGRLRRVEGVTTTAIGVGLVAGTDGFGFVFRVVNIVVVLLAVTAVQAGVQIAHNRAVDRR